MTYYFHQYLLHLKRFCEGHYKYICVKFIPVYVVRIFGGCAVRTSESQIHGIMSSFCSVGE
jgi:hypothetical protein